MAALPHTGKDDLIFSLTYLLWDLHSFVSNQICAKIDDCFMKSCATFG
jgi:hypothetical protein